jgi:cytochrome P450
VTSEALPSFGDHSFVASPYEAYDRVRAESPAYWSSQLGMFLVTRYSDVRQILADTKRFSSECWAEIYQAGMSKSPSAREILSATVPYRANLGEVDDPAHAVQARIVKSFLSPRYLRSLGQLVQHRLDAILDRTPVGVPIDFVTDVSTLFTITVMCDFVGVSAEDHRIFEKGSDAQVILFGAVSDEDTAVAAARDYAAWLDYIRDVIEARLREPREDAITHLLTEPAAQGYEPFDIPLVVAMVKTLILAGNETTRGLIGSCVLKLAENPGMIELLKTDDRAVEAFIEEMLRLESPVQLLYRVATCDATIGDVVVPAGSMVGVSYSAANRDEQAFECPARFDAGRKDGRHLAFGYGAHFCLGSPLARLEAKILLTSMMHRYRGWSLTGTPRYAQSFQVRNLSSLPIKLQSARG